MNGRLFLTLAAWIALSLGQNVAVAGEKPSEVYAAWYKVPPTSLAHRRAGPDEFTAAHNRLPLGTLVRLTNLKNGRTVVVRITDRGLGHTRAKIDICKEAAESLGFVRAGITRVRMEVLPNSAAAATADGAATIAH